MKLLFCEVCHDLFRLNGVERRCSCGAVGGKYLDDLNAEYDGGFAVPLGIANGSFTAAMGRRPKEGWGERFEAFVIPVECPTMKRRGE